MNVLRKIWHFLVGVKDALALILLLVFFAGVWALMRGGPPATVPTDAALVLALDGQIVDQANERSLLASIAGGGDAARQIEVRNVLMALDRAKTDTRIKAVVLELDAFTGGGQANLQAIGRALTALRAAGKPVVAYSTAYTDDSYYLAAHASQIWLNPLGGVLLTGPGGTNLYFKKALDKLDVDINVFRVGTYKSAVEPFTRSEASPESKAASQALVDTLWTSYRADVSKVRPKVDLPALLADLPARVKAAGGSLSQTALAAGLVDRLGSPEDFYGTLRKQYGEGEDDSIASFNGISLSRYLSATADLTKKSGDAVGIVYVAGDIVDGFAPAGTAGGDTIARQIDRALNDTDIKALVVRIDSPGGSVMASERIREALLQAKARKLPIVASFGPVAASGGYWVGTAADEIIAEPSTITGSIGVFAVIPSFNRLLDRVGIGADGVKSTPYTGAPDILRGLSPDTKLLLQASVEDIYRRFTGLVSAARKLPVERVDEIGQGRVWAGSTAKDLGLVDSLGGLDAAVAAAARRAQLPADVRTVDIERRPSLPFEILSSLFGEEEEDMSQQAAIRDPYARLARVDQARILGGLAQAQAVASGPTMQASCLDCAGLMPPRALVKAPSGWLATIAALVD
ncbi:signal peptide peptidase SppA [Polymorphobacter arshaanensis]|uniref:Signal peptide peptidase SppA n=1 Tax=Glacieibacterium arshaanense TaxID=2511025 RepID=A0A4Y9ENQ5_9SPHN|nr:signal peptide peptidase SppA [Polymorphobacter arshaanensis]TFU03401.1 signal peptide peptidase SppA [Polymorphobacter arshaanensis]